MGVRYRTTHTKQPIFERAVALEARTQAIARNITDFFKKTNRFAKTIVFCVDQEHADEMRRALNNLNDDLARQYSDYVCRITSEEGTIGKGHLSKFQELETVTPAIVTTSQLLTTGVDIPTCKNIVIARVVGSMVEFKQIIGRGTRGADQGADVKASLTTPTALLYEFGGRLNRLDALYSLPGW
jgi:type I restriction enzyme R subunit